MQEEERLYDGFVRGFLERGERTIPAEWPEGIKRRCRLFLLMNDSKPGATVSELSLLSILREEGIESAVELDPQAPPAVVREADDAERYAVERELGRGGMGRVVLAYDRDFRRRIAMKLLAGPDDRDRLARFLEEAQATAQLEHPNIPPVYDLGIDARGTPFFTMKWIRGRDLGGILRERANYSLIRLVQILQQAAMAVDFAHSRGVVHRDLKPQNIMVGDYGEVLVVDWGLAKILGRAEKAVSAELVTTDRREGGAHTLDGRLMGSLAYMPPELARGELDAVSERTDVFGLGAILYEILTGTPPYHAGTFPDLLEKAREARIEPPSRRAPDREIPEELEAAAMRALAADPGERFPSARTFYETLQHYVEGIHDAQRRREEARRLLGEAEAVRAALEKAIEGERELAARETALRDATPPYAEPAAKEPLWRVVEAHARAREEKDARFRETVAAYQAVLRIDPDNAEARDALAELFYDRLLDAETAGEREAARVYEGLVLQYDRGNWRSVLGKKARLRVESEPDGARVTLFRYRERGLLLVPEDEVDAGTTPLELDLPEGSYLLVLAREDHAAARYPVLLGRGEETAARLRLYRPEEIPPGFVQIPGGASITGGSPELFSALPRERRYVPEFFCGKYPVTFEEYCRFLDDVLGGGEESAPGALADREKELLPAFGAQKYVVRDEKGRYVPNAGLGIEPRMAVVAVTFHAAEAYAQWLGRRLGGEVGLLSEIEWERAARGADGRLYPWGNGFDWALCKAGRSRPGPPRPEPVGAFPADASPFGVRDLAGCVRELCTGWAAEGFRPCRGGSWYQPVSYASRADARTMLPDGAKTTDVGFRLAFRGKRI